MRVFCLDNTSEAPYELTTDYDGTIRIDRLSLPYFKAAGDPDGLWLSLGKWREHCQKVFSVLDQLTADWTPDLVDYHVIRPLGEECLIHLTSKGLPVVATLHDAWLICPRLFLLQSPGKTACTGPGPLKCLVCAYSEYDSSAGQAIAKLPWRVLRRGMMPAYRLQRRRAARSHILGAIARSRFIEDVHQPHIPGPVRFMPIGVDVTARPEVEVQRPRTPLRFGFLGGNQPHKGIALVLTACAELRRQGLPFELHVWGPGLDSLQEPIKRHQLEKEVVLRGMFQHEELWNVYTEIDVAVMATMVCEPYPRIVHEAAAAGIPAIAPAVGGIPEQIRSGENGLLFRFRDAQDLARQMSAVLNDPTLLERMMRQVADPPNVFHTVGEIERFYRQVLADQQNRPSAV